MPCRYTGPRQPAGPDGSGASGIFVVMFLNTVLGFAIRLVLARLLGVKEYGVYAYGTSWTSSPFRPGGDWARYPLCPRDRVLQGRKWEPQYIESYRGSDMSRTIKTRIFQEDDRSVEQLIKKIAKEASITFVGSILGRSLGYLCQFVLARLLGAASFGLYTLGFAILNLSAFLSMMGLDSGVLRYVSVYNGVQDKGRLKGTLILSISFSFLAGLGIGALVYFSSNWIATRIFKIQELSGVIKNFSVGVPFMSTTIVAATATRGFQKMQYFVYVRNFFQPISKLFLTLIFYWIGFKLYGAIWATVISAALGLPLAISYIRKLFPEVVGSIKPIFEIGKLFKFSIPLFLTNLIGFFLMWTDVLMLGYFCSASEVGIYRVASQIALLLPMVLAALTSIFAPMIAEFYNTGEMHKLNDLFKVVTKWGFLISLPIFLMIAFLADRILNLFGPEFTEGWPTLIILAFAQFVYVSLGDQGWVLAMCDRQNLWCCTMSIMALLNISLNLLLIPKLGTIGASVATGISTIGMHLAGLIETRYFLKLFPFDKRYLKALGAGMMACVIGFILKSLNTDQNSIVFLLLFSFSIVGVYISMLFLFRLDEEDKIILKALRRKALAFFKVGG